MDDDRILGIKREVARLNRVLAGEGALDAFGHASLRDPERPDRFFLPRSCAPELVGPDDVLEFGLDAEPILATRRPLYSERVIHGGLYRHRRDVGAICHHHSPSVLPFCLTEMELAPVTQLGAAMGALVPVWDCRTRFGATNHLVTTNAEADDLARTLGLHSTVLMRRHGATVVARDAADLAFRTIYGCRNAEAQYRAALIGAVDRLTPEEAAMAARIPAASVARAWDLWCRRLEGEVPDASPRAGRVRGQQGRQR